MMKRLVVLAFALGVLTTACAGGATTTTAAGAFPSGAVAIRASTDPAVGTERLLVGISLPDGRRLGSSHDPVTIRLTPPSNPDDVRSYPGTFIEMIPGVSGVYRATVQFDKPGIWGLAVAPADGSEIVPTVVQVAKRPRTVAVGEAAPRVPTPTVADHPLDEITTDPDPMPRLYEQSLDEALADGRTTVVVFATPAFCQSAACGPMLEQVKRIAAAHPDVDVVHVEIYEGFRDPGFAPDGTHLAPAVRAWHLVSEPWVFVVDASGTVVARFDGVLGPDELDPFL